MIIAGIDEVGRGPLAGPVVAASVILPSDYENPNIIDSKKLTHCERIKLSSIISTVAVDYAIAEIDNKVIDEINILQSTHKAMVMSIEKLKSKPDFVYIDGNSVPKDLQIEAQAVIKGDSIIAVVSAASIIAKVYRDAWMVEVAHEKYPQYNFARHKGYATKEHFDAIIKYGICPIHRITFLKKFFNKQIALF